jgi:hypothetical protein
MRSLQPVKAMKLLAIGALLLPASGLFAAGGCIYREKVKEEPSKKVVVEEHPKVIERDQTVIERH